MAVEGSTLVPTTRGWKQAWHLTPNDIIFDQYGRPQHIVSVQPTGLKEFYMVTLDDGYEILGDSTMGFNLMDKKWRDRYSKMNCLKNRQKVLGMKRPLTHKSISDLLDRELQRKDTHYEYAIPCSESVQFPTQDLPVPPYVLGVWQATMLRTKKHTKFGRDMEKIKKTCRQYGYKITETKHRFTITTIDGTTIPQSFARMQWVYPTYIPKEYILSSVDQRKQLIEGLVDGCEIKKADQKLKYRYCTQKIPELLAIQEIIESLGIKINIKYHKGMNYYFVTFESLPDFSVPYGKNRRIIRKVESVGQKHGVHIKVTGKTGEFLIEKGFIPVC